MNKKSPWIACLAVLFLVGIWQYSQSVSLTDIPNEAAGWQIKSVVNANNALIENAFGAGTEDVTIDDLVASGTTIKFANLPRSTNGMTSGQGRLFTTNVSSTLRAVYIYP